MERPRFARITRPRAQPPKVLAEWSSMKDVLAQSAELVSTEVEGLTARDALELAAARAGLRGERARELALGLRRDPGVPARLLEVAAVGAHAADAKRRAAWSDAARVPRHPA